MQPLILFKIKSISVKITWDVLFFVNRTCGDGALAEFDNIPGLDGTGIPAGPLEAWGRPGLTVGGKGPELPGPMPDFDYFQIKGKRKLTAT